MPKQTVAEEFLVLCYDPGTGRPLVDGTHLRCGLVGALIAELALTERVGIDGDLLYAHHYRSSGDPALDEFADRVAAEQRARKVKWWVQKTHSDKFRRRMLDQAVQNGVLEHEQRKALGVFTMNDYRPVRPRHREELLARLGAVLTQERPADDSRDVVLLALCGAVKADGKLFPRLGTRERRRLMKEVIAGDRIGQAVKAVIQSIEAATVAAVSASSSSDGGS